MMRCIVCIAAIPVLASDFLEAQAAVGNAALPNATNGFCCGAHPDRIIFSGGRLIT